MGNEINITGSNLQGTFAIGRNSSAVNLGDLDIKGQNTLNAFDVLSGQLLAHGVSKVDIAALHTALARDSSSPQVTEKKFGPATSEWMQAMFGKAINASWQIEIGIAGSLLASAIQKYYGW